MMYLEYDLEWVVKDLNRYKEIVRLQEETIKTLEEHIALLKGERENNDE